MDLGCLTNGFPAAFPARLALVVAAYSWGDNAEIAEEGRYLSPVAFGPCVEGLPLLVRHFCSVHAFRLRCGFFKFDISLSLPNFPKVLRRYQYPLKYVPINLSIVGWEPNPGTHRQPSYTS